MMARRIAGDWIEDLRLATGLLTRVPMPHPDGAMPAGLARAQRAFPLVGAMIGLVVGLADLSLLGIGIPPLVAATLALGAGAALTGACVRGWPFCLRSRLFRASW